MRYLIDTNIFVYLATDFSLLSKDVSAILISSDGRFDFYKKQGLDFIYNKK